MKQRFEALDAFRGLCALSVVLFHLRVVGSVTEFDFFRGSAIFVEFFFVLSGFVLAHGYGFKEGPSFAVFMKSRFFRLYPLHAFMFFVFVLLELGKLLAHRFGGFEFNNEPFTNSFGVREIIPNLLLIQSWTPYTQATSFNYPSWSISIEFYMYAIFYASIVLLKSKRIIFWFVSSLIFFMFIYSGSKVLVEEVLSGVSCFFGGAFTYVIYKKLYGIKLSYFFGSIVELTLILCVVLIVQSDMEFRSILAPQIFFVTVFFFAFESGLISRFLKVWPLQYAGKLSYSIYMTHAAIIFCLIIAAMVLRKITGIEMAPMIEAKRFLSFGGGITNNVVVIFALLVVIFVSSLTYKYVELTGQKLNRK